MPLESRKRDQSLWFDDGTVILATSRTIFWVYHGILSSISVVFRDMFSLPQPDVESTSDILEGISVVHLQDNPQVLVHLLNVLRQSSVISMSFGAKGRKLINVPTKRHFVHRKNCDSALAASLLCISTKYHMDYLREQVISLSAASYPSRLDDSDRCYATGDAKFFL